MVFNITILDSLNLQHDLHSLKIMLETAVLHKHNQNRYKRKKIGTMPRKRVVKVY